MGGEGLRFAAVNDVEYVDIVIPCPDLDRGMLTANTSSDLSMTMELRLNSQILNDLVQFFYTTSNIFRKPSCPIVSRVLGLLFRCRARFIWLNIPKKVPFMGFGDFTHLNLTLFSHANYGLHLRLA